MQPAILLTGASGRLGQLLLPALVERAPAGAAVFATWRHRAPATQPFGARVAWMRFDLAHPTAILNLLDPALPLAVLHFASTISNEMGPVLRLDCYGTETLVKALKARSGPAWFVFASSIDAELGHPYGIGKAYLESSLAAAADERFRPLSVRIPAIEAEHLERWHLAAGDFPSRFLDVIRYESAIESLGRGRLPDGPDGPVYLVPETRGIRLERLQKRSRDAEPSIHARTS